MRIKLGICEDDPFTLATLTASLEFEDVEVVISTASPNQALEEFKTKIPHAMLIDLHLGDGPTGLDLAQSIRAQSPETGIVFLTSFESPKLLDKNFKGFPSGSQYLNKRDIGSVKEILLAVQKSIAKDRKSSVPISGEVSSLTKRQLEVLELVAEGFTNTEIASRLELKTKTVEGINLRIAKALRIETGQNTNQRIQMAKTYLRSIGRIND